MLLPVNVLSINKKQNKKTLIKLLMTTDKNIVCPTTKYALLQSCAIFLNPA